MIMLFEIFRENKDRVMNNFTLVIVVTVSYNVEVLNSLSLW
jgi:hypothetical protein